MLDRNAQFAEALLRAPWLENYREFHVRRRMVLNVDTLPAPSAMARIRPSLKTADDREVQITFIYDHAGTDTASVLAGERIRDAIARIGRGDPRAVIIVDRIFGGQGVFHYATIFLLPERP